MVTPSNTLRIASSDAEMASFFNFCCQIHQRSECKEPACNIKAFVNVLHIYLKDPRKTEKDRDEFFICHCKQFINVFTLIYRLSQNKKYSLELLEALKESRRQKDEKEKNRRCFF